MEDYLGKLGKMSAVHAIPLKRNYKIKVFKRDKNILISLNVYIFLNIYVVSNTLIYHLKVFMLYEYKIWNNLCDSRRILTLLRKCFWYLFEILQVTYQNKFWHSDDCDKKSNASTLIFSEQYFLPRNFHLMQCYSREINSSQRYEIKIACPRVANISVEKQIWRFRDVLHMWLAEKLFSNYFVTLYWPRQ